MSTYRIQATSVEAPQFSGSFIGNGGSLTGLVTPSQTGSFTRLATGSITASVAPTQFSVASGSTTQLLVTGTGVTIGNAITDAHSITGSLNIAGSINATSFTGSLSGTASFVSDPEVTRDLYNLTASVNIGNTLAATTASVGQFSLPANTPSGSMITMNGFFSSTSTSNTKTPSFLINDSASSITTATFTGGLQFILSGRVVNSTTIRFFRAGGTINIGTAPSFVDITSVGGVWSIKTSVTVNTGAGAGITNTLEALTVRL